MKKIIASFIIGSMVVSTSLSAQEAAKAERTPQQIMAELAKASQNPVSNMNTIPFQFNWFTGGGLGNQSMSQTLIQPILPLPLTKKLNIVSRTVVPVINMPAADGSRIKGIADMQEQLYITPANTKKVVWGFGPIVSLPTSSIAALSSGQFAAGPTAVLLAMPGKFVVGAVANQMWRVAGSTTTKEINSLFVQPFVNYNLKRGWALMTAPVITNNWSAASKQQLTLPIGMGISKITLVGKQPLSISMQYYHNAIRPDRAGADQIRMQASFLFPR